MRASEVINILTDVMEKFDCQDIALSKLFLNEKGELFIEVNTEKLPKIPEKLKTVDRLHKGGLH